MGRLSSKVSISYNPQEFKKAYKVLKNADKDLKEGATIGATKFSNRFYKKIRRAVRTGGVGYNIAPLSPFTLEKRRRYNITSDIPFNFFGIYYSSIQLRKTPGGVMVGFKKGVRHPVLKNKKGLTIAQIAYILEKGGGRIPKRDLWAQVYKSMGGDKAANKQVRASIRTLFRNRYNVRL